MLAFLGGSWAGTDINLRWGAFAWSSESVQVFHFTKPKSCI
jgi:hypothetical protein